MKKKVLVMAGDGIGQEVVSAGLPVMKAAAAAAGVTLELDSAPIGGAGYDAAGTPLPDESLKKAKASDAVLFGAVGGPKWDTLDFALRPEKGLLKLRAELGLFANLRPATVHSELIHASTLKQEVVEGCDVMVL